MTSFRWERLPFSVRDFAVSDLPALQALLERCGDYSQLVEGQPAQPCAAEELLRDGPPGRGQADKFLVLVEGGSRSVAGVLEGMRGYPGSSDWWIGLLLLAPDTRGRGLGGGLVEAFCDYAARAGCRAMMLGVVEENTGALKFWDRLGFQIVRKTEPRAFGRKVQAVWVMRRELLPPAPPMTDVPGGDGIPVG